MNKLIACALLLANPANFLLAYDADARFRIEASWEISEVPAGFPVGFCLLTTEAEQYVAFYDKQKRMTVASRSLQSDAWTYQRLPSSVGWDSHNYITMAIDTTGQLHVSGNMHGDPLVYFRTEEPGDITTLARFSMTGENEDRCTYPKFMRDADNQLVFHYRDGGSGRGNDLYNIYNPEKKQWRRLLDTPLTDGQGRMNAYVAGPTRGPDGFFHCHWVWRDTPDCATNHHLSYARSRDLIHWESAFGDEIETPITIDQKSLWIDPIPSGGGIINGGHRLFFGEDGRPIVTYHKSDPQGNMQIYIARPEGSGWSKHPLTDWEKPIQFSGRGSMGFIGIRISGLERIEPGLLTMTYRHRDYGRGRLFVEEETLQPVEKNITLPPDYPAQLNHVVSDFPGMGIRRATDTGDSGNANIRYLLQWETLGRNRDRPRKPPLPEPSMLKLYKLSRNQ